MKCVIFGGSGQVGQILKRHWASKGYELHWVGRSEPKAPNHWPWDGQNLGDWSQALEGADVVINLSGRSVNCRYTESNLKEMLESRVQTTELIGRAIEDCKSPPGLWINMSTGTIYAHSFDQDQTEESGEIGGHEPDVPDYWGYSVRIAKEWEAAQDQADTPKTRKVAMRAAMVMSGDKGGVFSTLFRLTTLGLGGSVAGGAQYISWIHEDDFVGAVEHIIKSDLSGTINLASPRALPQKQFMKTLQSVGGYKVELPATGWMAEIGAFILRTDTELLLKSRRIYPERLLKNGFQFKYENWEKACKDLIEQKREKRDLGEMKTLIWKWAIVSYLLTMALIGLIMGPSATGPIQFKSMYISLYLTGASLPYFLLTVWGITKIFPWLILRSRGAVWATLLSVFMSVLVCIVVPILSFSLHPQVLVEAFNSDSPELVLFTGTFYGFVGSIYGLPFALIGGGWLGCRVARVYEIKTYPLH